MTRGGGPSAGHSHWTAVQTNQGLCWEHFHRLAFLLVNSSHINIYVPPAKAEWSALDYFFSARRLQMAGDFRCGDNIKSDIFIPTNFNGGISFSLLSSSPPTGDLFSSLQAKSSSSAVFVCLGCLKITASGRQMVCLAQNNDRLSHNERLQRRGMNNISA